MRMDMKGLGSGTQIQPAPWESILMAGSISLAVAGILILIVRRLGR